MIKRDEISDPTSCLNRAALDEPIFVLRANDELAASLVRDWATRYAAQKAEQNEPGDGMTVVQKAKQAEAFLLAEQMDAWHKEHANS